MSWGRAELPTTRREPAPEAPGAAVKSTLQSGWPTPHPVAGDASQVRPAPFGTSERLGCVPGSV